VYEAAGNTVHMIIAPDKSGAARKKEADWSSVKRLMEIWAKQAPSDSRWERIKNLARNAECALAPYTRQDDDLQCAWDRRLRRLHGKITEVNWVNFCPLRTSREEDWSDWLAWLLETSTTGLLAHALYRGASWGWAICAGIAGHSPRYGEAEIDCGFWWNAPDITYPILYASFFEKPKELLSGFRWQNGKRGISSFERWGRTFLYAPVPETVEIEAPLNRLLDQILKRLSLPA
jgi:hypothetical protein